MKKLPKKFPIITITGSSGSGTSTVRQSFQHIFKREKINATVIEGDSYHKYERAEMDALIKQHDLVPGGKMSLALQFIFTPQVLELLESRQLMETNQLSESIKA